MAALLPWRAAQRLRSRRVKMLPRIMRTIATTVRLVASTVRLVPIDDTPDVGPFLEDCTRTEPAIFAIYVQPLKQPVDSPCNLQKSHSGHRAIFAPPAAGRAAIVRDGPSSALILVVLRGWLGRSQLRR